MKRLLLALAALTALAPARADSDVQLTPDIIKNQLLTKAPEVYGSMNCDEIKSIYFGYAKQREAALTEINKMLDDPSSAKDQGKIKQMQDLFAAATIADNSTFASAHIAHDTKHCPWIQDGDLITIDAVFDRSLHQIYDKR
jgi:hypothetical protein